jgi:hypothetical protein
VGTDPYVPFIPSLADEMIYLVVMKLASKHGWKRVAEDFRTRFDSEATAKDCESKFNKDLKRSKIFRLVWREEELRMGANHNFEVELQPLIRTFTLYAMNGMHSIENMYCLSIFVCRNFICDRNRISSSWSCIARSLACQRRPEFLQLSVFGRNVCEII